MKWIEPENGGNGIMLNLSLIKSMRIYDDRFIRFDEFSEKYPYWEYPDESSRDADYDRIRRIALEIDSQTVDPYGIDWSIIPGGYDYVATDEDGKCNIFSYHPYRAESIWMMHDDGDFEILYRTSNNPDWRNSLRVRPGIENANA